MKHPEFSDYTREQIYAALLRFKRAFPTCYRWFFLSELEKPYSPFESEEITFVSEKDMEYLRGTPAPLKITIPVVIEKDEQNT